MKKLFFVIAVVAFVGVGVFIYFGQYEHEEVRQVWKSQDSEADQDEDVKERMSVLKQRGDTHNYREFYIEGKEMNYRFMVYDSCHHKREGIRFNADYYLNDGVPAMFAFVSPDRRFVYVVGDILANSTGWISTFIVYRVDTSTLKAELVDGVAAIRLEKKGFTVASMSRCLSPEDEISANMKFLFHDVTYDFDGKVRRRSREYAPREIEKQYGPGLCNLKGLGIKRGE